MDTQTSTPAKPDSTVWFRKELVTNNFLVGGKPVPFVVYEGNRGLLGLEDTPANSKMIEALREASGSNGIVAISAEEADEFKKKVNPQTVSVKRSSRGADLRLHTAPPKPQASATEGNVPPAKSSGTVIEQITQPPAEAGFIIPPPPAAPNGEPAATSPPRHKPETRRVVTPEKAET